MTPEAVTKKALRELRKIKKNAYPWEWEYLVEHINTLDGEHHTTCVYGLMTGHCHSDRSLELIDRCSHPLYFIDFRFLHNTTNKSNTNLWSWRNFTALEALLFHDRDFVKTEIKLLDKKK
jgi:hypothetical protein